MQQQPLPPPMQQFPPQGGAPMMQQQQLPPVAQAAPMPPQPMGAGQLQQPGPPGLAPPPPGAAGLPPQQQQQMAVPRDFSVPQAAPGLPTPNLQLPPTNSGAVTPGGVSRISLASSATSTPKPQQYNYVMERFRDTYAYHTPASVHQLSFDVEVWTQTNIGESDPKLFSTRRVNWGEHIMSLEDGANIINEELALRRLPKDPQNPAAGSRSLLDEDAPTTAAGSPKNDTSTTAGDAGGTSGGNPSQDAQGRPSGHRSTDDPVLSEKREFLKIVMKQPGATLSKKFLEYCTGPGRIFTRPPSDPVVRLPPETTMPVTDPPHDCTNLDILHQKRELAKHGRPMQILLAIGYAEEHPSTEQVRFVGVEAVITAMFLTEGDGHFRARPSLEQVHTAYVDARTIFTAKTKLVPVTHTGENGGGGGGSGSGSNNNGGVGPNEVKVKASLQGALKSVASSYELKKLKAAAQAAANDDEITRQKKVMLKQAVGAGSTATTSSSSSSAVKIHEASQYFTPLPLKQQIRLHVMGTIESVEGIPEDTLFVKFSWAMSDNWATDVNINDEMGAPHQNDGISQLSYSSLLRTDEGELVPYHVLNVPFAAHVIGKPGGGALRMVVEVHSLGRNADGYQTLKGYGQVTIPDTPGNYMDEQVLLWAPKPTGSETLKSVFIGGAPSLASIWDVVLRPTRKATASSSTAAAPPSVAAATETTDGQGPEAQKQEEEEQSSARLQSRAGLQTISVGTMRLRYFVALQVGSKEY